MLYYSNLIELLRGSEKCFIVMKARLVTSFLTWRMKDAFIVKMRPCGGIITGFQKINLQFPVKMKINGIKTLKWLDYEFLN